MKYARFTAECKKCGWAKMPYGQCLSCYRANRRKRNNAWLRGRPKP